jgi:hypothetical protein
MRGLDSCIKCVRDALKSAHRKRPYLQLFLEFNDIAGKRHGMAYEMEFVWHMASHAFEAELIPRRA